MKNRGRIAIGAAADLVQFDKDTIARGDEVFVEDFPGEARRYIRHARGIERVIVNGAVVREADSYTSGRAGTIV
jgi:N-acyl-D-aspartate/D-glutamate deacylase